jgi:DNA-binding NarL/FixJ family response regulator
MTDRPQEELGGKGHDTERVRTEGRNGVRRPPLSGPAGAPPVAARVAVVDSDANVEAWLRSAVGSLGTSWLVTRYLDGKELFGSLRKAPPDAVLMETDMPGFCGITWARRLRVVAPGIGVVMHSARADAATVFASFAAGARGYLVKPVDSAEVVAALVKAIEGQYSLCARAQGALLKGLGGVGAMQECGLLSPREQEVLACLLEGLYDKEISTRLAISERTVHRHWEDIFGKLEVHDRGRALCRFLLFATCSHGNAPGCGRGCLDCSR